jgi:hypothetical protein
MFRNLAKGVEMTYKNIQWWKIAVCVLGVLMIAGAVTYTLITRTSASSAAPATGSPALSAKAANASPLGGTGEMKWVTDLNSKWASNDFIVVVFPGNDDLTGKANETVKSAAEKMREAGTAVEVMTLSFADPEFQSTLDRLAIQKLPSVLVLAATGQGAIVKGDITETKLLQAYLTLQKTCVPGSGCCGQ